MKAKDGKEEKTMFECVLCQGTQTHQNIKLIWTAEHQILLFATMYTPCFELSFSLMFWVQSNLHRLTYTLYVEDQRVFELQFIFNHLRPAQMGIDAHRHTGIATIMCCGLKCGHIVEPMGSDGMMNLQYCCVWIQQHQPLSFTRRTKLFNSNECQPHTSEFNVYRWLWIKEKLLVLMRIPK